MKIFNNITLILLLFVVIAFGQHRGDDLAFQGLSFQNESGVKAQAMGNAFTSVSGDVSSLFWNPAGLARVPKFQLSISANQQNSTWRENQVYRTNRYFLTLPFYLERLYTPDPANNGLWDHEIFNAERDSNYIVQEPKMGDDVFSKDAAEWQKDKDEMLFDNIAMVLPVQVSGKTIAISAGFQSHNIADYDRNDTYLDPHIGFTEYGDVERVANDTLRMNWSEFERSRFGDLNSYTAGLAYDVFKNLQVGASMTIMSGETDDAQSLNRVGWFDLVNSNRFMFSYDTLNVSTNGTSKFSANKFNLGTILSFERFSLGLLVKLPFTMEREWSYSTVTMDSLGTKTANSNGIDKMKAPAVYSLGLSFKPVSNFLVSFDFESNPYSKAEFDIAGNSADFRNWVDQNSVRFGVEYKPFRWFSLLGGYKNVPATFVPDGAAFRDEGPKAESYTMGAGLDTGFGRLDVAYEIRKLKYYDSYYSNTNYAFIGTNNLLVGYTLSF